MKYLKRFNESTMFDYEDYLFSFFEKDPNFIEPNDNWLYVEYHRFSNPSENLVHEQLRRYLNGPRFSDNLVIKTEFDYGDIYILIVNKQFYDNHIKVEDLNWEEHGLAKELKKTNVDLKMYRLQDAKVVNGLPNNCSLIRGLNFSGGIEFWPKNSEPDPIYVKNNIELQYLLYKYAS